MVEEELIMVRWWCVIGVLIVDIGGVWVVVVVGLDDYLSVG